MLSVRHDVTTTDAATAQDAGLEREFLDAADAVFRFAQHLTRDPVRAQDLAQETFLRAWTHRRQYQAGSNCCAWLCTICRNLFVTGIAREKRESVVDDAELEALASAAVYGTVQTSDPTGQLFEGTDVDDAIRRALDRLPETHRMAVMLVDVEDHTYEAAAEILGVPVGTVRSRLFRGRRLLQEDLLIYAQDAGLFPTAKE